VTREKIEKVDGFVFWVAGMNLLFFTSHTVDGRNPAPVDMENIPLFWGIYTFQVVQEFFHQQ